MLKFKSKKGEVAALLTLGLVIVGTLITLGTSFFVNNKKTNLASNSRATEVDCGSQVPAKCNGGNPCVDVGSSPSGSSLICCDAHQTSGNYNYPVLATSCLGGGTDLDPSGDCTADQITCDTGSREGSTFSYSYSTAGTCANSSSRNSNKCFGTQSNCTQYTWTEYKNKTCGISSEALPEDPSESGSCADTSSNGVPCPNLACCFYKNGKATVYAKAQARVNNEMSTPCTTEEYGDAYGAESWGYCNDDGSGYGGGGGGGDTAATGGCKDDQLYCDSGNIFSYSYSTAGVCASASTRDTNKCYGTQSNCNKYTYDEFYASKCGTSKTTTTTPDSTCATQDMTCNTGLRTGSTFTYSQSTAGACADESTRKANKCYGTKSDCTQYTWNEYYNQTCGVGGGISVIKTENACIGNSSVHFWYGNDGKYYSSLTDTTGDATANDICYSNCSNGTKCKDNSLRINTTSEQLFYGKSTNEVISYYTDSTCSGVGMDLDGLRAYCTKGSSQNFNPQGQCIATGKQIHFNECNYFDPSGTQPCSNETPLPGLPAGCTIFRNCPSTGEFCGYECYYNGNKTNCIGVSDQHNEDLVHIFNSSASAIDLGIAEIVDDSAGGNEHKTVNVGIIKPGETIVIDISKIGFSGYCTLITDTIHVYINDQDMGSDGCGGGVKIFITLT